MESRQYSTILSIFRLHYSSLFIMLGGTFWGSDRIISSAWLIFPRIVFDFWIVEAQYLWKESTEWSILRLEYSLYTIFTSDR